MEQPVLPKWWGRVRFLAEQAVSGSTTQRHGGSIGLNEMIQHVTEVV